MVLRRPNWPDIDDVVAMNADRETMRYVADGRPMTGAQVLAEEMPRLMAHNGRADNLGYWIACDRVTGNFLGWFTMAPVEEPVCGVALGYRLRRGAWGHGYAIEGVLLLIEMARAAHATLVLARLVAADVDARRVMETAGLILAATSRSEPAEPIGAANPGEVYYSLDLTLGAPLTDVAAHAKPLRAIPEGTSPGLRSSGE